MMKYRCFVCGEEFDITLDRWWCRCGGVLDLVGEFSPPSKSALVQRSVGTQRYIESVPISLETLGTLSLGVGRTPLVAISGDLWAKLDFLLPTGSFKDRGAEMVVGLAHDLRAERLVVDSSGNSASAMAAHGARCGIAVKVFAPASGPKAKLDQISRYGAEVSLIEGSRLEVRAAALEALEEPGTFYASHVEIPHFIHGTKLWAYEVVESLGRAPDSVVLAVGNGSMLLGAYLGFSELLRSGWITQLPKLIAVQAEGFASLSGETVSSSEPTLADGIAIREPRRLDQMQRALQGSGGSCAVVSNAQIRSAWLALSRMGLWVEPTGAVPYAYANAYREDLGLCVVNLGGAGSKAP